MTSSLSTRTRRLERAAVAFGGWLLCAGAFADTPGVPADAQARYLKDRAACNSGRSNEDKATCLKEAGAVRDAAGHGTLTESDLNYQKNALARCQPLPPDQRQACIARIHGAGTTEGSADQGGIFRELVTPDAPKAPQAAPPPPQKTPPT